jgi:flagellar biosynthetic protein FliR
VNDFIQYAADRMQLFVLLLMRIGGMMLTAPVFSHRSVPVRLRVGMTIGFAALLLLILGDTAVPQVTSLWALVALALKELVVGLVLGLVFAIVFLGVRLAGSIVGYQIGFAMVNVVDPNSDTPASILGEYWFLIATLVFLTINGHHVIVAGLFDSFRLIPLGTATIPNNVGEWFIKYSSYAFVLAVKFAAPVIITVFLAEVAMGVIARTMPQMNIFIVGFPLKIMTGLFLMGLSLPVFAYVLQKVTASLDNEMAYLMHIFTSGGKL